MDYSYSLRGTDLTRAVIARALRRGTDAVAYAAHRWGRDSNAAALVKAGVSDVDTADLLDSGMVSSAQTEFIEEVNPLTILGKLQGLRRVRPQAPYCPLSDAAVAYWRGESKPLRASRLAFTRARLPALSVGALLVVTKEAIEAEGQGEELLRRDLIRAVATATDASFIDRGNAGVSGVEPASITYAATAVASSGDVADDLEAAIEAFTGDLSYAAWVLHPKLAASIALRTGGLGIGADIGLRGGSLLGLPAIVSASCPLDTDGGGDIVLLDPTGIAATDEGIRFESSENATVELDDAPTGATDGPVSASAHIIGVYQEDGVAMKVTRATNWSNARSGGVVVVTGAAYGNAS